MAGNRFFSLQILTEVQYCIHTLPGPSGYSAYLLGFGLDPRDIYGWRGDETSISGQCAPQWKRSVMAQEAILTEMANRTLRRLLARNHLSNCIDVKVGE